MKIMKCIKNICMSEAIKSPCNNKHSAIITKGRTKIICKGYNTNKRSSYLNEFVCCQHAEMAVATKLYNQIIRKKQNKFTRNNNKINLSKYVVWVCRIPNDENLKKIGTFKNSEPCIRCCNGLKKLGFRKLRYSNDNGNFINIDLRYFKPTHISHSQLETTKYSKLIK